MSPTEERLNLEIIKLLIQVAWADGEVADDEVEHLRERARAAGLGDKAIAMLDAFMGGERKLPAPDFGFLREHRDEALAAAEKMVISDEEVRTALREILAEIHILLDG